MVEQIWINEQAVLARLCFPEALALEAKNYRLHPVLLDVCTLVARAVFPKPSAQETYLPMSIKRFCVYDRPEDTVWVYARVRSITGETILTDLYLLNDSGTVVAEVEGQAVRCVNSEVLLGNKVQAWLQNRLYAVEWRPQVRINAHLPSDYLPTPEAIAPRLQDGVDKTIAQSEEFATYGKVLVALETLSVSYIVKAFQQVGWQFQINKSITTAKLATNLAIAPRHRRLFARLLQILAEAEILRRDGETWTVCSVPERQDIAAQVKTLLAQYPIGLAELTLLERCGSRLAEVLQNKCDPLQLLFPQDDMMTAASIYQDSVGSKLMNGLMQKAVTMVLTKLPTDRQLRVLEIGAGTGGATAYILPKLPAQQTEYVFTDISPLFTSQAQEKFADYKFVRYQLLDIEQAPAEQGFANEHYDLIVAFNVLHATQDLRRTLQHVQTLLAPKGMLFLLENTLPMGWIDLIWGLTEGWWRFTDLDLRPAYPLLTVRKWQQLLQKSGFEQAVGIAPDILVAESMQAIIIAQKHQNSDDRDMINVGHWLVFADIQGMGQKLADLLTARGEICTLVFAGKAYEQTAEHTFTVNPARLEDFKQLLTKIADNNLPSLRKVVHLWSLDAKEAESLTVADLEAASLKGVGGALHLVQALAKFPFPQAKLWLVTRNTQSIGDTNTNLSGVAQAPLWGLGKNIALEYSALWGGMVDLGLPNKEEAVTLLEEIGNSTDEDQIAFREGQRYVARLVSKSPPSFQTIPLHAEGTYLIAGGLGAFGLKIAQWLVDKGVRHLVLIGRRGVSSNVAPTVIDELEQAGTEVLVAKADVSVEEDMRQLFDTLKASWPPLRGIVHAAGLPGYCAMADLDYNTTKAMLAPKVLGTWILSQLTKDLSLDFFACCSSMVSVWGAKGQSHYVAANQFLDSFAHYRQWRGLPILSVNLGPLTGGGMLSKGSVEDLAKLGVTTTEMEQAVKAFGYLLGTDTTQTIMADIDWHLFKSAYEAKKRQPLFEEINLPTKQQVIQPKTKESFLQHLQRASAGERHTMLTEHISITLAQVLGMESKQWFDSNQGFFDIGMDSLTAIELKNRLQVSLDKELPTTLAFDYTTIETMATYLMNEVLGLSTQVEVESTKAGDMLTATTKLEQLSEEEVEALLLKKLAAL